MVAPKVTPVSGYRYDRAKAAHAIACFEQLEQSKGEWAGEPLQLLDWERELTARIFGCVDEHGHRQYRTVFVFIPRKNGKTSYAGALADYLAFADGEPGAEVYVAAHDKVR